MILSARPDCDFVSYTLHGSFGANIANEQFFVDKPKGAYVISLRDFFLGKEFDVKPFDNFQRLKMLITKIFVSDVIVFFSENIMSVSSAKKWMVFKIRIQFA